MSNKTLKERAAALWEPGTDSHLKALDVILFGVVSIAAVGAFVFQSVERFADREDLFLGGMFTIFALLAVMSFRIARGPVIQLWGSMLMLAFAAFLLFLTGSDAVRRSDWNDRRCYRIQAAMLQPGPKTRTDLADVFTALQCRPQGLGPAVAERSDGNEKTEAQRKAENERASRQALEQEVAVDAYEAKPAPAATGRPRKPKSGQ